MPLPHSPPLTMSAGRLKYRLSRSYGSIPAAVNNVLAAALPR